MTSLLPILFLNERMAFIKAKRSFLFGSAISSSASMLGVLLSVLPVNFSSMDLFPISSKNLLTISSLNFLMIFASTDCSMAALNSWSVLPYSSIQSIAIPCLAMPKNNS